MTTAQKVRQLEARVAELEANWHHVAPELPRHASSVRAPLESDGERARVLAARAGTDGATASGCSSAAGASAQVLDRLQMKGVQ